MGEEIDNLLDDLDEFEDEILDDGKSEDIDENIVDNEDEVIEDEILDDSQEDEIIEDSEEIVEDSDGLIEDSEEVAEDDSVDLVDGFEDVLASSEEDDDKDEEVYPPPADNKHKVVAQLDEVTKESEEKASQILDIMDEISTNTEENLNSLKDVLEFLKKHKSICEKLHQKFPHIKTFEKELKEIDEMMEKIQKSIEINEETSEKIFMAMDIMQYQDIHRQKIERVINIMRALIKYMNKLFEGSVEDEKRVKSARHIHGDETEEVLSDEDIEALLDQFGV